VRSGPKLEKTLKPHPPTKKLISSSAARRPAWGPKAKMQKNRTAVKWASPRILYIGTDGGNSCLRSCQKPERKETERGRLYNYGKRCRKGQEDVSSKGDAL